MPNWFNRSLTLPNVKHSVHDLSHDYKTSLQIGYLTPVNVTEILPSDKLLSHSMEKFMRFAPLKFPTMHRIKVHSSNFFVPIRIVLGDDLYEKFLNGKVDIQPVIFEQVQSIPEGGTFVNPFENSILDYLGLDIHGVHEDEISEYTHKYSFYLPNPIAFFGYLCIVRDWYTDSVLNAGYINLVNELIENYRTCVSEGRYLSGLDFDYPLFNIAYSKDYFNTARPEPQLGSEMYVLNRSLVNGSPSNKYDIPANWSGGLARVDPDGNLTVPTATPTGVADSTTIRDLWKKEMLQRYFEIDNTFGSRIREKLAGHYGVKYSDQRLQIPLYCGGSSDYAQISEVLSLAGTSQTGLGAYAGKAIVAGRSKTKPVYFEEHGVYISLVSLIPDNGYCTGQDKHFFKTNIFDFASPEFNNVGWQDVYKGELFSLGDRVLDTETWGYQPRYSEYRMQPSRCTGAFRTSAELAWHLNRNFSTVPPLNDNFIKVADTDRIFSDSDADGLKAPIYVDIYHSMKLSRPISYEPDSMHLY